MTTNIQQNTIIEKNYAFDDAASIVFCPPFFDDAKYPSTTDLEKNRPQNCNLDKVQSRGKPRQRRCVKDLHTMQGDER